MPDITFIFINAFILLIWFRTDAIYEYFIKIPILNRLIKIDKYKEFRFKYPDVRYPIFLNIEYNSFFTRLISCPICLNTWLALFALIFIKQYSLIFVIFFASIILYYISVILMRLHDREGP